MPRAQPRRLACVTRRFTGMLRSWWIGTSQLRVDDFSKWVHWTATASPGSSGDNAGWLRTKWANAGNSGRDSRHRSQRLSEPPCYR